MKSGSMEWMVRVRIKTDGEVVYGGGISYLLQKTDELGSLLAAAKEMGMSYRKALQIVKRAEAHLNEPLLTKMIGGAGGGGSELTDFARSFVYRFQELEQSVLKYTQELAEKSFIDFFKENKGIVNSVVSLDNNAFD